MRIQLKDKKCLDCATKNTTIDKCKERTYFLKEYKGRNLDFCVNVLFDYYLYSEVIGRSDDIELGFYKRIISQIIHLE